MPPVPSVVPSWSTMRRIHSRLTATSGQLEMIAASFNGMHFW
jgi:hypothetical protein